MVQYRSTHQSLDFDGILPCIILFADFKQRALELDKDIGLFHLRIQTDQNIAKLRSAQ